MKLGIIGAMDSEVTALQEALQNAERYDYAGMRFCAGQLGKLDAVVVKCGMGKVNAAMCVQLLKDRFEVTHVINTGVAGALSPELDIGDIVISEEAVQHDFDLSPIGFQKAQVPPFESAVIPADPALKNAVLEAANAVGIDIHILCGRICSGDQFIAGSAQKQRIISEFGGLCAEMEGAAIAQACTLNAIPFAILRAVSDRADDTGGVSFAEFEAEAAKHCISIVLKLAEMLSA